MSPDRGVCAGCGARIGGSGTFYFLLEPGDYTEDAKRFDTKACLKGWVAKR